MSPLVWYRHDIAELRISWRSAIRALTRLSTIPLSSLNLPASFAPPPDTKPYFPRQVTSLLKVSAAQSRAKSKDTGKEVGEIWGTKEFLPWFEEGANRIARDENARGVGSIVHGDFKLDNMVRPLDTWFLNNLGGRTLMEIRYRSFIRRNRGLSLSLIGNSQLSVLRWQT